MQTDYVRVYQFANQNPTAVQAQAASPAAGNNDPVAHVNALGQSGTTGSGSPAPAPTPSPSSSHAGTPAGDPGSGSDSLSVRVSGDHWVGAPNGQPDPQFVVLVDGHQVGGVQTVQAVHDAGQWQDITLSGSFANPQQVDIRFLNDQYGGSHAQDINLYVDSVTLNGHQFFGSGAQNSGSQGYTDSSDPNAALMTMNGDAVFNVAGSGSTASGSTAPTPAPTPAPAPAPTPSPSSSHAGTPAGDPGSGSDSLSVRVSGDHWVGAPNGQPDPQFVVLVDGHQVGGVQTVQAVHDAGQWQDITLSGSFANPQQVDIRFLNDQYGGSHAQDINLYVDSVTLNGHQFFGSGAQNSGSQGYTDSSDPNAALMTMNGDAVFNVAGSGAAASGSTAPTPAPTPAPAPAPTPSPSSSHAGTPAGDPGSGSGSLSVRVSGDHWVGAPNGQPDPQFV